MALTPKQAIFVDEYLIDLNATQASIRAGYSKKSADIIGFENLRKPNIKAAVARALSARSEKTKIDSYWVLTELVNLYKTSIADFLVFKEGRQPYFDISKATSAQLAALDEVQIDSVGRGDDLTIDKVKIKLSAKLKTLETIGRHVDLQAFKDSVEVTDKGVDKYSKAELEAILNG